MNEKDFEDLCQSLSIYLAAAVYDCSSFFLPREVTVSPQFATQRGNLFQIYFIPSDIQKLLFVYFVCNRNFALLRLDELRTRKLGQSPPESASYSTMNSGCRSRSLHLIAEQDISWLRTHSFCREQWIHGHIFKSFLAPQHSLSRGFEPPPFHSVGECHDHQTTGDPLQ